MRGWQRCSSTWSPPAREPVAGAVIGAATDSTGSDAIDDPFDNATESGRAMNRRVEISLRDPQA